MSTTQPLADTRQPDRGRAGAAPRGWRAALPTLMVVMLLIAEGVLLLANHGNWFSLRDYKGWGVLLAVASVLVTVAILGLWWAASLLFRRRFSFSLRCLLLLILAVAVPSAWLASALRQARQQQELREHGCDLYKPGTIGILRSGGSPPLNYKPPILARWLGDDFFDVVTHANVDASSQFADAEMELLATQTQLSSMRLKLEDNERLPLGHDTLGMHLSLLPDLDGGRPMGEARPLPAITDAGVIHLGQLKRLQYLSLVRSRLVTDAGLQPLSNLTRLENLHISGLQKVGDDGLAHIAGLRQLHTLTLSGNEFTGVGLRHLSQLDQLKSLTLHGSQFSDAGIQHLSRLTSLQSLSASNTSLGDAAMEQIGKLTNLRLLELDHTLITDAGCMHLKTLPNLQTLRLRGTQITDAGLVHFVPLQKLTYLSLDQTKVTPAGRDKLRRMTQSGTLHTDGDPNPFRP